MLRRARQKLRRAGLARQASFVIADVTALPFRDGVADAAVNAFMLRHMPSLPAAFTEFRRVLRAGGRLGCIELTQPTRPVFRQVYRFLFRYVTPLLGGLVSGDFEAFRYLPRSLAPFPGATELSRLLREAGFEDVKCHLLSGGIVAVHVGRKTTK